MKHGRIPKEQFGSMMESWLNYAQDKLSEGCIERSLREVEPVKKRVIEAGYASEYSLGFGKQLIEHLCREEALQAQLDLIQINKERLKTLAHLAGRKMSDLVGTTVVSVGGGPGDKIAEPWFPRFASVAGADVINFDSSPVHPIDKNLGIYTHLGESRGNIFRLLANDQKIYEELAGLENIHIIECNNLIGNNVSPQLGIDLGTLIDLPRHPKVAQLRNNLIAASRVLLVEGGIAAIDNVYWQKSNQRLNPIDENGQMRKTTFFHLEPQI